MTNRVNIITGEDLSEWNYLDTVVKQIVRFGLIITLARLCSEQQAGATERITNLIWWAADDD